MRSCRLDWTGEVWGDSFVPIGLLLRGSLVRKSHARLLPRVSFKPPSIASGVLWGQGSAGLKGESCEYVYSPDVETICIVVMNLIIYLLVPF